MTLQTTWFFLWGLIWAVFFITDGFDFGIGTLYPFITKDEKEKRTLIHAMGPFWDGNEVWLITAGGVTFAAFPLVYSVMFSSMYTALMLLLFSLILRGVAFEFREKVESHKWKRIWDTCIFIGSFAPALLLGVAFANIFKGLPIDKDGIFQGNFFSLLNPYGISGGVLFTTLFLLHGTLWLLIKTTGDLKNRVLKISKILWPVVLSVAALFLVFTWFSTQLYDNYMENKLFFLIPLLAVASLIMTRWFIQNGKYFPAWFSSAATIIFVTFFGITGLFPNMYPSSIDPTFSLTAFNASSSPLTLKIMLVIVLIFIPIVIGYQIWVYYLFKDPITDEDLSQDEHY